MEPIYGQLETRVINGDQLIFLISARINLIWKTKCDQSNLCFLHRLDSVENKTYHPRLVQGANTQLSFIDNKRNTFSYKNQSINLAVFAFATRFHLCACTAVGLVPTSHSIWRNYESRMVSFLSSNLNHPF
jgi:hypothetical protein